MNRVFSLRRTHLTTGDRIEFDNDEEEDLLLVKGGEDMEKLFKYTGLALDGVQAGHHEDQEHLEEEGQQPINGMSGSR